MSTLKQAQLEMITQFVVRMELSFRMWREKRGRGIGGGGGNSGRCRLKREGERKGRGVRGRSFLCVCVSVEVERGGLFVPPGCCYLIHEV